MHVEATLALTKATKAGARLGLPPLRLIEDRMLQELVRTENVNGIRVIVLATGDVGELVCEPIMDEGGIIGHTHPPLVRYLAPSGCARRMPLPFALEELAPLTHVRATLEGASHIGTAWPVAGGMMFLRDRADIADAVRVELEALEPLEAEYSREDLERARAWLFLFTRGRHVGADEVWLAKEFAAAFRASLKNEPTDRDVIGDLRSPGDGTAPELPASSGVVQRGATLAPFDGLLALERLKTEALRSAGVGSELEAQILSDRDSVERALDEAHDPRREREQPCQQTRSQELSSSSSSSDSSSPGASSRSVAPRAPEPWWEVLGVLADANESTVRDAFRELARVHHPDVGGDAARMAQINAAMALALQGRS